MCRIKGPFTEADATGCLGDQGRLTGDMQRTRLDCRTDGPGAAAGTKAKLCKAQGCTVDVCALGRYYNAKKRLCEAHMRADAVCLRGSGDQLFRYCQQCGKLQSLALFEGNKRSCRSALARRRSQAAALNVSRQHKWCALDRADEPAAVPDPVRDSEVLPAAPALATMQPTHTTPNNSNRSAISSSSDSNLKVSLQGQLDVSSTAVAFGGSAPPAVQAHCPPAVQAHCPPAVQAHCPPGAVGAAASNTGAYDGHGQAQHNLTKQRSIVMSGPVLNTGFFEALLQQELANGSCSSYVGAKQDDLDNVDMGDDLGRELSLLIDQQLHGASDNRTATNLSATAAAGAGAATMQQQQQRRWGEACFPKCMMQEHVHTPATGALMPSSHSWLQQQQNRSSAALQMPLPYPMLSSSSCAVSTDTRILNNGLASCATQQQQLCTQQPAARSGVAHVSQQQFRHHMSLQAPGAAMTSATNHDSSTHALIARLELIKAQQALMEHAMWQLQALLDQRTPPAAVPGCSAMLQEQKLTGCAVTVACNKWGSGSEQLPQQQQRQCWPAPAVAASACLAAEDYWRQQQQHQVHCADGWSSLFVDSGYGCFVV